MNPTEVALRAYFDAFNQRDEEALLATLSPNVLHEINEGEAESGLEAFRAFRAHMNRCYREEITDLVVMTYGERGAAEFTCSGTYLQTDEGLPEANGQTYAIRAAVFVDVPEGKITRITSHYNLRAWIAAVTG